jgi:transcriptional regulator with XRE-family HTH domain
MMLTLLQPGEMGSQLADRVRTLRLGRGWTRNTLASRAGVSTPSLRRFETTGKASLELVLKVTAAMGRLDEFGKLLVSPPAGSIEELERRAAKPGPKRGRI